MAQENPNYCFTTISIIFLSLKKKGKERKIVHILTYHLERVDEAQSLQKRQRGGKGSIQKLAQSTARTFSALQWALWAGAVVMKPNNECRRLENKNKKEILTLIFTLSDCFHKNICSYTSVSKQSHLPEKQKQQIIFLSLRKALPMPKSSKMTHT